MKTFTGNRYRYATYGAACTEVEIDCLTGDHTVTATCYPPDHCYLVVSEKL